MINPTEQFPALIKRCEDAVREAFPIEGRKYKLTASNFKWENLGDHVKNDVTAQKKAKLTDSSIFAKMRGDLTLKDATGKVVDTLNNVVILQVPHITARDSFVVDGKDIQTVNQLRLRPGLYVRPTADNNVETFVNTSAAGVYKIILDRKTGDFSFRVQTSHFPLTTVLRALGISNDRIIEALGRDVFNATDEKVDDDVQAFKLFEKLRPTAPRPASLEEARKLIASFLNSKPLDPLVNQITLSAGHSSITGDAILDAAKKCIKLSKNEVAADDTESLAFKSLHSVEDFVSERIKEATKGIKFAVATKLDRTGKIKEAFHPGLFTKPVTGFFNQSEFARFADQVNPLEMVSTNFTTTVLGEGGIGSTHSISDDLRSVHPSHAGVIDPIQTPEGQKIGVTGHLSLGAAKSGNNLTVQLINAKTGALETKTVQDVDRKIIAFPDQFDLTVKPPRALAAQIRGRRQAEIKEFRPSDIEYIIPRAANVFSISSNAIPFLHTDESTRAGYTSRHLEQTVPLKDPDVPLVQANMGGIGFEAKFGQSFLPKSPVAGRVTGVTSDLIKIKGNDGKLYSVTIYDKFPLNSNTYLHNTPTVKVGDVVKKDQVIAESNYTKNGTLALGKNLRVAYMPYKGMNFEDGIVISENCANKMTSIHKYEERLDRDSNTKVGMNIFLAHYPDEAVKIADKSKYDASGVIKKGAIVHNGDLLVPAVRQQELHEDYDFSRLHKALKNNWVDVSLRWENDHNGVVEEVVNTGSFVKVILHTEEPTQIGDKFSMRHGGKGIVTAIIPDKEMYHDKSGKPLDIIFNPAGVVGRRNPGQLYEAAAGKLAKATGTTYIVDNFAPGNVLDKVTNDLKKAGLDPHGEESVTDPTTGRTYNNVLVGDTHFLKLKHLVSKKFSARGVGGQYTMHDQPAKTEEGSAQRVGGLELFSLLAGDARQFVKDAFSIKGNRNDEYWRALQNGLMLPKAKVPFVAEKFNTYMLGSGINLQTHGTEIKALPLTDGQIKAMSKGSIKEPTVITANNLKPERDGLFDPAVTGGIGGTNWSHIELAEPIVNPLMTKAVASILDLTEKDLMGIVDGSMGFGPTGSPVPNPTGKLPHGGEAIMERLKKINVDAELTGIIAKLSTTKSVAVIDKLNKRRRYLLGLRNIQMRPEQAYMNKVIPVIPPKFRSINPLPDGSLNVSDANHGYREVLMVSNALRDMKKMAVDPKHIQQLRGDLYRSVSGLVGMTEPITRAQHFKGFLQQIKGAENKIGFFQGKLMSRPQDLSARSTVVVDHKLGIDQVGIPESMGLTIYEPFVVKRLVGLGHTAQKAKEMIQAKDPLAIKALHLEAAERPVIMNRAPSLHKFNVLAFKPTLVPGQAIRVNPLIVKGYNMDFDGDTAGIHVPISELAKKEAFEKLLPSKNMFSPGDNRVMHMPEAEAVLGLFMMTDPKGTPKTASSSTEVLRQYHDKKCEINQAFTVGGKIITPGFVLLNEVLPADCRFEGQMTKKMVSKVIGDVARKHPDKSPDVVNKLKDLGNHYVTEIGFSVSLRDLKTDLSTRDKILNQAKSEEKVKGFAGASLDASKKIKDLVHANKDNRFVYMSSVSGAFGGKTPQVAHMVGGVVAVQDHMKKLVPVQIRKSFAEGLSLGEYWTTMPGSRKGMVDKGLSTGETGYLNKLLVNSNMDNTITVADCGTTDGVEMAITDPEIVDRVVADGPLKGQILTPDRVRQMSTKKMLLKVRTPLKCKAKQGTCQQCFGLSENGKFYPIGYHIGILAAQTIGEPSTQMALRAFHFAGAIGSPSTDFPKVDRLFKLPSTIKNKEILAMSTGKVSEISRAPAGGWIVVIDNKKHFVPEELGLGVTVNQMVHAGDRISKTGEFLPHDLLAATGDINRVRNKMIDELHGSFKESGIDIKRRMFETVIKPMTNRARVTDPGDGVNHDVHVNDVMQVNVIEELNKKLKRPIKYEPTLIGVIKVPHENADFIGRMQHDRLIDTMRAAPALGMKANFGPDGHPITQLAFIGTNELGVPVQHKFVPGKTK